MKVSWFNVIFPVFEDLFKFVNFPYYTKKLEKLNTPEGAEIMSKPEMVRLRRERKNREK